MYERWLRFGDEDIISGVKHALRKALAERVEIQEYEEQALKAHGRKELWQISAEWVPMEPVDSKSYNHTGEK